MSHEETIKTIKSAFPVAVQEAKLLRRKRISVTIKVDKLREVASFIKEELGFDTLVSVGGIDYIGAKIFQVVYYVWSSSKRKLLMLKVNVHRNKPTLPSLIDVWEAVDYHEREAWEMFGIEFRGHPNLTKFLLPEEWSNGFPLRKDFEYDSEGEN